MPPWRCGWRSWRRPPTRAGPADSGDRERALFPAARRGSVHRTEGARAAAGWAWTRAPPGRARGAWAAHMAGMFSGPGVPGNVRRSGWFAYIPNWAGVTAFGHWWPWVAWSWTGLTTVGTALAVHYEVCVALKLCFVLLALARYLAGRPSEPADLGRVAGRREPRLEWRGPDAVLGFDNRYFMERVRGRGSNRRHLDMVCRSEGRVARLQLSFDERHRIDQSGLRTDFTLEIVELKKDGLLKVGTYNEVEGKVNFTRKGDQLVVAAGNMALAC